MTDLKRLWRCYSLLLGIILDLFRRIVKGGFQIFGANFRCAEVNLRY